MGGRFQDRCAGKGRGVDSAQRCMMSAHAGVERHRTIMQVLLPSFTQRPSRRAPLRRHYGEIVHHTVWELFPGCASEVLLPFASHDLDGGNLVLVVRF